MKEYTCRTLIGAIERTLEISRSWGDTCGDPTVDVWYRGVNTNAVDLLPSAYWKNKEEISPFRTFRQLVGNYIETSHYDAWDLYSLARHYELPTRLLDWTEGIMQALFFAFDKWDGKTTPCIWIMCPVGLNKLTVREEFILTPPSRLSNMWLPPLKRRKAHWKKKRKRFRNELPIAIYPKRSNPRIQGQQGVFTVHGTDKRPINDILRDERNSDQLITRIDLVGFDPVVIKRDLTYLGMHEATIYPDADHLANDVKYLYHCK